MPSCGCDHESWFEPTCRCCTQVPEARVSLPASEYHRLRAELAQLRAGVQAAGQDQAPWEPTKWWQITDSQGRVWCQTRSEDDARRAFEQDRQTAPDLILQRLYERQVESSEWRDVVPPPPTSEPIPAPTAPPEEDELVLPEEGDRGN